MRLLVNLRRVAGEPVDLAVETDAGATVGEVADAIMRRDPIAQVPVQHPTLSIAEAGSWRALEPDLALSEAGLRSGATIAVQPGPMRAQSSATAAVLTVHSGPEPGRTFELPEGTTTIGRGADVGVRLSDPMVSTVHARIIVGQDGVELIDENSSNGILQAGQLVPRVRLGAGERVVLGETTVSVKDHRGVTVSRTPQAPVVDVDRSPRVEPVRPRARLVAPEPPEPPKPQRFPLIPALLPLVLGVGLFAVTKSAASVVFVALSPMMLLGTWWENKRGARRELQQAIDSYHANLAQLVTELQAAQEAERVERCAEHPGTIEVAEAIRSRGSLLWTRRPEHESFMDVRLGLGTQPSRVEVEVVASRRSTPELQAELSDVVTGYGDIMRVPVVASFDVAGSIGVSGPLESASSIARGLLVQLLGLHSPAELAVVAMVSARNVADWAWIRWMPHVVSEHNPVEGPSLASAPPSCLALAAALDDLIRSRLEGADGGLPGSDDQIGLPRVLLLVDDEAPIERSRLVGLAEDGPAVGIHVLWVATSTARIPAACRAFVEVETTGSGFTVGRVVERDLSRPVLVEPLPSGALEELARAMAPMVDSGARSEIATDLPRSMSFLADAGTELARSAEAIAERWRESNSLPDSVSPSRRLRRDNTLRALVGRAAGESLHLDIRTQGPHALVGGTTGSGKSEFLQSWIMGMATAHSPLRVNFLFVDYKGGAAFAECVRLPHTVGLVTDLSPHLVRRALISLNAELRHREHVLNAKRAKDLLELERHGDPEAPPSLVIVVDEFAALVQEVPEFVDGVVNVAQRGRSLGLHLILATQRPAGVIKDNLRANTNLRVALRMADEDDSTDVIGTPAAAAFPQDLPGRAIAKTGPGRLTTFQGAYVGGWTAEDAPPASVVLAPHGFDQLGEWSETEESQPPLADPGPTDLHRLVDRVSEAHRSLGLSAPRRPWLSELARGYNLTDLPMRRTDAELVFGVLDDPESQAQPVVGFRPDVDGHLAVLGTGGSGKSATLRTIAVSAAFTKRGGPCFVYGLDFGARGLSMIEDLPHVGSVVPAADPERVARLVRQLREEIDERAVRFSTVNAGTLEEYRRLADRPDEPRVLLLLDGMAAFRSAYETGPDAAVLERLISIAADGRPVGVHVVITADRPGSIPTPLASAIQRRLVLRLANEADLLAVGAPADGFAANSPAGRGYVDGTEVQVAVLGRPSAQGNPPDQAEQARAIKELAQVLRRADAPEAPPVAALPERVDLSSLPLAVDGMASFAVGDEKLEAVGLDLRSSLLIAGPAFSGKTTAVQTVIEAIRRTRPTMQFALLGQSRSTLAQLDLWASKAAGPSDVAALAQELSERIASDVGFSESLVVVIEGLPEFLNTAADMELQDLVKVARAQGTFVIVEGESSAFQGSWPLLQAVKAPRHGLVLQPSQIDGDALFGVAFPKLKRSDFPDGRGMYVHRGRVQKVQVALP